MNAVQRGADSEGAGRRTWRETYAERRRFVRDRIPSLVIYTVLAAIVPAVFGLAYAAQGVTLSLAEYGYLLLLEAALAVIWMLWEFTRYRQLRAQLRRTAAVTGEAALAHALRIDAVVTREEEQLLALLQQQYAASAERILALRRAHELHLEHVRLWIHQMKTPVSVIDLLRQEALHDPELPVRDPAWMNSLEESKQRLADGLERMLQAARLEQPDRDLSPQRTDLVKLTRETINRHKSEFIRSGVYPKLEVAARPDAQAGDQEAGHAEAAIEADTDAKWLQFALGQITSNAIKYTRLIPEGGERTVTYTVGRDASGVAYIAVRDSGIGIPPEDLPRIFEPFFTGANGRRTSEATGMGLYLAARALERIGHRISAQSQPGEGTTVAISFPQATLTKL